jgi:MFS family permease
MKRIEDRPEQGDRPQRLVVALYLGGLLIMLAAFGAAWVVVSVLGIDLSEMSFFAGIRTLLLLVFAVLAPPLGIFGEYWLSRWQQRPIRRRNILLVIGVFALFPTSTVALLTAFNTFLSDWPWYWQMLLTGLANIAGLTVMAIAIRSQVFKEWRD